MSQLFKRYALLMFIVGTQVGSSSAMQKTHQLESYTVTLSQDQLLSNCNISLQDLNTGVVQHGQAFIETLNTTLKAKTNRTISFNYGSSTCIHIQVTVPPKALNKERCAVSVIRNNKAAIKEAYLQTVAHFEQQPLTKMYCSELREFMTTYFEMPECIVLLLHNIAIESQDYVSKFLDIINSLLRHNLINSSLIRFVDIGLDNDERFFVVFSTDKSLQTEDTIQDYCNSIAFVVRDIFSKALAHYVIKTFGINATAEDLLHDRIEVTMVETQDGTAFTVRKKINRERESDFSDMPPLEALTLDERRLDEGDHLVAQSRKEVEEQLTRYYFEKYGIASS